MNLLDELIDAMLGDNHLHIEPDRIRVTLFRSNFELWLIKPNVATALDIKARDEADGYAIPVGIKLVNRESGKEVRGFGKAFLHPWWLRRTILELAAAVAYAEREWDLMGEKFIAKMEEQYK